jgi:acetyl-CoA C-acetyltransferase
MTASRVYIVAARRSAIGRIGGLHRSRRIEDLAAPVAAQALADAGIEASKVDALLVGNTTAGNNPARVIALLAGLPDRAVTLTIDRHTASGLEAIGMAVSRIASGEAEIVVAGGAEAQSTAPWRIAKPRTLYHIPRFIGLAQSEHGDTGELAVVEAAETLAKRHDIPRSRQDEFAVASHIKAGLARDGRRLVKEIVPLRTKPEESRDELPSDPDIEELESIPSILGEGTLTTGNTSLPADGAAFVVAVSERVHQQLGSPPALVIAASASIGVAPAADVEAPIEAARVLAARVDGLDLAKLDSIELGETSAVQAIAFQSTLGLSDATFNTDGGQVARGQPAGAASAVLVVKLFSRLIRDDNAPASGRGAAVIGAAGGQGLAALFERV